MKAVQWGCRIVCSTAKCEKHTEVWSEQGCPSLPFAGAPTSGPMKGWYLRYEQGNATPPYYTKGHIAFCPEHSAEAITFLAEHNTYRIARNKVGRDTAMTLLDRVAEWLSPATKRSGYTHAMHTALMAWDKEHPVPRLPWGTK